MRTCWRTAQAAAPISNLVFDGLRSLGAGRVTEEHLAELRKRLPAADRQRLLEDLALAPSWMQPLVRQIVEKGVAMPTDVF